MIFSIRNWSVFCAYIFLPLMCSAYEVEKIQTTRPDGSPLNAYYTPPLEKDQKFPLCIIIHGSQCESILNWHHDFVDLTIGYGAGLITLEKQGIFGPDLIDYFEFNQTNCLDHRLDDHLFVVDLLRNGLIPNWNGKFIIIGGSEGARIAAALASQTPEVAATCLYTAGGGMTTPEEIKLVVSRYLRDREFVSEQEIVEYIQSLDEQFLVMYADPDPEKIFLTYTHKWWVSHLRRHSVLDMLRIKSPIFYAHGTDDEVIPIESADRVAEIFKEEGRTNFTFHRVDGCGHDMRLFPPSIIIEMMQMLEKERPALFPLSCTLFSKQIPLDQLAKRDTYGIESITNSQGSLVS